MLNMVVMVAGGQGGQANQGERGGRRVCCGGCSVQDSQLPVGVVAKRRSCTIRVLLSNVFWGGAWVAAVLCTCCAACSMASCFDMLLACLCGLGRAAVRVHVRVCGVSRHVAAVLSRTVSRLVDISGVAGQLASLLGSWDEAGMFASPSLLAHRVRRRSVKPLRRT